MALTQISTAGVKDDAVTAGKIPADAIGSSEIAANAVGSSELADNAVDTAAIANDAVTSAKIADGTIVAANIANDTITATQLANNSANVNVIVDGAVTAAKLADDAVTAAKLANDAVISSNIVNGAVDSDKIADATIGLDKLVHGTSSNDGKFLRANNGADPTFETVTSTTINNNADNRVITGSGTANTLEGESALTFDGSTLTLSKTGAPVITIGSTNAGSASLVLDGDSNGDASGTDYAYLQHNTDGDLDIVVDNPADAGNIKFFTNSSSERLRIDSSGKVGINETNPQQQLHVHDDTAYKGILVNGNGAPRVGFARSTTTDGEWSVGIDGTNGEQFVINKSNDNSNNKIILSATQNTMCQLTQINGNLKFGSAGNGIDFSATSDASGTGISMDNELFKDYEEGSWTPVIKKYSSGSWVNATMTTAGSLSDCYYVKIGDICHFHIGWSGFEVSDASYCVIGGLPFASEGRGQCVVTYTTAFSSHQNQGGHISAGGDQQIQFYHTGNAWNGFNNNTSGLYIYADGWYRVA